MYISVIFIKLWSQDSFISTSFVLDHDRTEKSSNKSESEKYYSILLHFLCKAVHVKNTWGSHCDKLIFMSTEEDKELGAVALEV